MLDQIMSPSPPGIIFTMRYPNNSGYVSTTVAKHRDLVARALGRSAKCLIAYPRVVDRPVYEPQWLETIKADFYDYSNENCDILASVIRQYHVQLIVFMSAEAKTVNLKLLRQLGVRTVNTENDSYDHKSRNSLHLGTSKYLVRRVLQYGLHDTYVANSVGQFEFLRRFAKIPPTRLVLISDGVDTSHFIPAASSRASLETGLDPGRLWIMSASQARPEKRLEFVIEAARRILATRPDQNIGFVHVGDGECLSRWRETAVSQGLGDRFRFVGYRADLAPFFQASSIFAHAAIRESFGLVIVEAMSCGLPVIATTAAGPQETIQHGKTGFLVPPDDIEKFTFALQRYIDDQSLRKLHGANGRERAQNLYSIEHQATKFAELLQGKLSPAIV